MPAWHFYFNITVDLTIAFLKKAYQSSNVSPCHTLTTIFSQTAQHSKMPYLSGGDSTTNATETGRGMQLLNSPRSVLKRSSSSVDTEVTESPSPHKLRKPMRKRAKTQEEKEERAQERIMRNRAAAQVSRERKREHMATLEIENEELMQQITTLTADNNELRSTMMSLSERLAGMEKMLAFFTAPGSMPLETTTQFSCPTPPGTIRPQDLQSNTSTPILESIDSRNPAVIAFDPQRRISMRSPWTPSSRSPMYKQMESILLHWTTILRITTSQAFTTQILTYLTFRCCLSQKQYLHRLPDQWRSSATGQAGKASTTPITASSVLHSVDYLTQKILMKEEHGLDGKRRA